MIFTKLWFLILLEPGTLDFAEAPGMVNEVAFHVEFDLRTICYRSILYGSLLLILR